LGRGSGKKFYTVDFVKLPDREVLIGIEIVTVIVYQLATSI